ncbi:hypothetical protein [Lysinibacillus sp. JNUCC-52]|uniref:hypothetical protein n=1 Tax=Lysinibacillus sp. JNUCC-52 TaxID=2792480 RepID=UPI001937C67D|nr:hypothetical protein JNUCC52_00925 [Lysinibacillus sp. JNUCC-52]
MNINLRKIILTIVFFFLILFSYTSYDYFKYDRFEWGMNFSKTFMTFFFIFLYEWASTGKKQEKKDQESD